MADQAPQSGYSTETLAFVSGFVAIVTGVLYKVVPAIAGWAEKRRGDTEQVRRGTIAEWQGILDRERGEYAAEKTAWRAERDEERKRWWAERDELRGQAEQAQRQLQVLTIHYTGLRARLEYVTRQNERLRGGEHPLAASLERADGVILAEPVLVDAEGRPLPPDQQFLKIDWVNEVAEVLLGYGNGGGLVGRRVEDLVPERYLARHRAGWQRALRSGRLSGRNPVHRLEARTRDGSETPIDLALTLFTFKDLTGFRGQFRPRFPGLDESSWALPVRPDEAPAGPPAADDGGRGPGS